MKFMANSLCAAIIAMSLSLGFLGYSQAQAAVTSSFVKSPTSSPASIANRNLFDRALNEDAIYFAEARGISYQAAVEHLKVDDAMAAPISQLRTAYSNSLAGIYIEHDPTPRIVVRLKGVVSRIPHFFDTGVGIVPVDFIFGAAYTKVELHRRIAAKLSMLKSAMPDLQGIATDDKTGEVVLDIFGDRKSNPRLQSFASNILGVPTRVHALPAPLRQNVTGSGSIDGGTCTGAFVVEKTDGSASGLITAGHCPNNNATYSDLDGTTASLTFQAEAYTASNDVQWYTTSNINQPIFYASAGVPRTLTGRRTQASTAVGDNVCHYGATSGYSCGNVEFTDYQPTSYTCNGAPCSATYIAVTGPGTNNTLACGAGDSGGPWFVSTVALGVHSGGASTGSGVGECLVAIYTSTDRISELGLQLLYGN